MQQPGAWVALLVYRDEQAEVLGFDRTLATFRTRGEALQWLEQSGYMPAERALEEHLVDRIPPDLLHWPRVRVAAKADGAESEALDDADAPPGVAVDADGAKPPRAVAVRTPEE